VNKNTFSKLSTAIKDPLKLYTFLKSVLKGLYYKIKYEIILKKAKFGKNIRIRGKLIIKGPGNVIFGNNVICDDIVTPFTHSPEAIINIGNDVFLNGARFGAAKSIVVESNCILADCRIIDNDFHSLGKNRHSKDAPVEIRPVHIGFNVWVGAQSAVLKGVTIGENSVVGFGAVVTSDLEPNIIAVGNPARAVKKIPE